MNKEFIPYEQALELKELGFDQPCLAYYYDNETLYGVGVSYNRFQTLKNKEGKHPMAPTYSQAFRWFREKHGLYHHIVPEFYTKGINFNWQILWYLPKEEWTKHIISDGTGLYGDNGEYPTQEEAELACLIKLIEILKNEKLKN